MAQNQQLDSLHFDSLDFPYNTEQNPLAEKPRIATGQNTYVTWGGSIAKRPGTVGITGSTFTKRIDRMWLYQTLEATPKVYILASAYNSSTTYWEMYYLRLDAGSPAWTIFTNIRNVNTSQSPHECVIALGHAYIKSRPNAVPDEMYGSIRFDGTGGTVTIDYWGIGQPANQVIMDEATEWNYLTVDVNSFATTINVDNGVTPAAPFNISIDSEIMTVTNKGTGKNWTVTRGVDGTTPTEHYAGVKLRFFSTYTASTRYARAWYTWQYAMAYKTRTGHIGVRSAQITDPASNKSDTGPIKSYRPKFKGYIGSIDVTDTVRVPKGVFFRTTDGGGTFFKLVETTNPGTVGYNLLDEDKYWGTGNTNPLPDEFLSANEIAPSLTSNAPPPTCNPPKVVGVDVIQPYSPIAYYAGRIWFAIDEYLYFSAQEEITMGNPEESFPSGLTGNFFRYQHPVRNIIATTDGLYVLTTNSIHQITGTNRESFNTRPVLENIGVPENQPRAATRMGNAVAFLSSDERILLLEGDKIVTLSDPLGTIFGVAIAAGKEVDFHYYRNGSYEWLVVNNHKGSDTTVSVQRICDLSRSRESGWKDIFWYPAWTVRSTACVTGRIKESETRHRLVWYIWDGTNGRLVYLDDGGGTTFTDADPNSGNAANNYAYSWGTNLFSVPPGNHINALRKSAYNPIFHEVRFERKTFSGDAEPTVTYYVDDNYETAGTTGTVTEPTRRDQSHGYKSLIVPVRTVAQRVAVKFNATTDKGAEFHNLALVWNSEGGS